MNGLSAAVITACAAALIGSLLSGFVSDGGAKKLLRLVLGAFTVCAMILPVCRAATSIRVETDGFSTYEELTATADEALRKQVVHETEARLAETLLSILEQSGLAAERAKVVLAETDDQTLIIARVTVYIPPAQSQNIQRIRELTEQNLHITPDIITESS